ncbi:MAG: hypothetical protein Q8M91_09640, partial [Polaromonas sp.]|nr:hypothetical protein [Polaromonas sp.]
MNLAHTLSRKSRWIWMGGVALVVAAAGATWFVQKSPRVDVLELRYAPLLRTLQFSARVATLSRVDVGSTVTGRVAQVRVAEG